MWSKYEVFTAVCEIVFAASTRERKNGVRVVY